MRFCIAHVFFVIFALIVSGCALGPDFKQPAPPQIKSYTRSPLSRKTVSLPQQGQAGKAQFFVDGKDIPAEWWTVFHSHTINELIDLGLTNSPTVAAAKAALVQAQETATAQIGASFFPAISGQFPVSRQAFSNALFGGSTHSSIFTLFNPSFNIAYTFDIFGGMRRGVEALCAEVDYQAFELEAAYLTLTSNIVTTTINIAALDNEIKVTQALILSQEKTLRLVRQQFQLGGASGGDVLAQQTQLAQTRASLPPLEQSLAQNRHVLAVLVGHFPSENAMPALSLDHFQLPAFLPVSLPSALVQQRPDIRAAEALLHAASAQIGIATANLLPQVNLTGSYGWIKTNNLADLFSKQNAVWNIATQLTAPIFNGGALLAKRRAAIAAFDQANAQYRQVVLQAFQNVADSLRAIENDAKTFKEYSQAEIAARHTLTITRKQYRLGGVSYLSLLNAERQYQQTKIARIQAQANRYNDTVALFQALGGGWWNK